MKKFPQLGILFKIKIAKTQVFLPLFDKIRPKDPPRYSTELTQTTSIKRQNPSKHTTKHTTINSKIITKYSEFHTYQIVPFESSKKK